MPQQHYASKGGRRGYRKNNKNVKKNHANNSYSQQLKFRTGDPNQAHVFVEIMRKLRVQLMLDCDDYPSDIVSMLSNRREFDFDHPDNALPTPINKVDKTKDPDAWEKREEIIAKLIDHQVFQQFKRKKAYKANKTRLCGFICKRCTRDLILKLEQKPGYHNWSVDDPLEFLNQIEQVCVLYQENDYPTAAHWKVIQNTINLKQSPNESVSAYSTRFDYQWTMFYKLIQWIIIGLENEDEMSKLSENEIRKRREAALERLQAYVFLVHSDHKRYGQFVDKIANHCSVGSCYPTTLAAAKEILQRWENFIQQNRSP
jgi:hypothetical protein